MGRFARWRGVVGLAVRRFWRRATAIAPRQVAFTISGIAIPVALLVIVTSISFGLAAGGTIQSQDVDYWVVPESGASSPVVSVGGPSFGAVHEVSARLNEREDVRYASPVLLELVRVGSGSGAEYVIAIGVVPGASPVELAGASTAGLTPGDPHYADGTYNGTWTDEAVLSHAASTLLETGAGERLQVHVGGTSRDVTVANASGPSAGSGNLPVLLMHLSELQSLTGAASGDQADQLLVQTTDPGVRPVLEGLYPRSIVLEKGGIATQQVLDSSLALAVGLTALAVALIVGALSAATTLGLAVAASSSERAVLAAIGISGRSRATMLAVEALLVSLLGGVVGVAAGFGGIPLANRLARRFLADVTVARWQPALAAYGLAVALAIGLLVLPYLLLVSRRTTTIESLIE